MASAAPAFDELPGHRIRRLQQIAVAIFMEETAASGITPVQFAALQAVQQQPLIDQRTLARHIAYDTSTLAGVVDRLEARGLLQRQLSAEDRRVRLLVLTEAGQALLADIVPAMLRAQARIMAPLPVAQHALFMDLLGTLIAGHEQAGRLPREAD